MNPEILGVNIDELLSAPPAGKWCPFKELNKSDVKDMSIASITASVTHSLLAASTAKSHAGRSAAHSTASGPRLS